MGKSFVYGLTAFILAAVAVRPAMAQHYEYHPAISDRFSAVLGWMRSNNSFKAEAEDLTGERSSTYIDFEDTLGVDSHSTLLNTQIRFKITPQKKWSVFGQYFSNSAKGEATLSKDVDWDGDIFREGTGVGAGVKLSIWRLFFGRSLILNKQHDLGIGAGIHNLDANLYIEGNVIVNDQSVYKKDEVGGNQILPNVGAWYHFSPARRWLVHARVDWISAEVGDYDGSLWNATAGVNFQAWRNVGIDVYWQYFNLNGGVEKTDWRGRLDMTYSGPVVAMTFNW